MTIAAGLGVGYSTVLRALDRHEIVVRSRSSMQRFRSPAELSDPDWLRAQYASKPGSRIAAELGMSLAAVHKAMHRHGVEGGGGVGASRLALAASAAETPAGAADGAIRLDQRGRPGSFWRGSKAARSIREITAEHAVSDRTVMIERRRFGLAEARRRR